MLVFQIHNSHARHGTTFEHNPPPFAPLMDSTRPTKQIAIPTLSVTVHSLLLASSPLHSLVVIYLEKNLQVLLPHGHNLHRPEFLSISVTSPCQHYCLKPPDMENTSEKNVATVLQIRSTTFHSVWYSSSCKTCNVSCVTHFLANYNLILVLHI